MKELKYFRRGENNVQLLDDYNAMGFKGRYFIIESMIENHRSVDTTASLAEAAGMFLAVANLIAHEDSRETEDD